MLGQADVLCWRSARLLPHHPGLCVTRPDALPTRFARRLLGVSGVCSRDTLARALEKCVPSFLLLLLLSTLLALSCRLTASITGDHTPPASTNTTNTRLPVLPLLPMRRALTHPPSVGYSQQCLLARGSALKRATEMLLDLQVCAYIELAGGSLP